MWIAGSLEQRAVAAPGKVFAVFVEAVSESAREDVRARIIAAGGAVGHTAPGSDYPFLFAQLTGAALAELVARSNEFIASIEEDFEGFDKRNLTNSLILEPLLGKINAAPGALFQVIIDVNQDARVGRDRAIEGIRAYLEQIGVPGASVRRRPDATHPYIFVSMSGWQVRDLARSDQEQADAARGQPGPFRLIYKIWEDSATHALISRSVATVKADAAQIAFCARGAGVVWAVMDSGIQADHVHFQRHGNLEVPAPVEHHDFSIPLGTAATALVDRFGHGTHVAGILAGASSNARIVSKVRNEDGSTSLVPSRIEAISGMAPECKLVSLKVLNDYGQGQVSWMIDAIESIQKVNDYGRRVLIHGVNISVGYGFDPEWFACGQSPLCVEVNRLVKSGVVVVVAAGNTGYGFVRSADRAEAVAAGQPLSINDPGNADLAITVGSTHRYMPHTYGVSYFSSKGPTGDGRCKPDLVAPGEKILSCAAGRSKAKLWATRGVAEEFDYLEDSGTSMAAPHVSGVIAAFLSIRPEYICEPEKVKRVFLEAATDLGRDRMFQGTGLVDLMRAIQSV